ncbi:SAM-dependent methyltransferase [Actinocorallia herbida]|uniref:SAM-dependent methyltransferase n=1 Tax=Actinocorallia herbida TaxID=58109 RepID=UPI001FE550C0|nr:SAM-dependent methyltransferase [Actinocorallia herbida]
MFAEAVARLLATVDTALGGPARLDFVDMGAGDGALAEGVLAALPEELRARVRATAVEVAPRPSRTVPGLVWATEPPARITGLVVANEWLDNVPLDLAVRTPEGPRLVLVDGSGREGTGREPDPADLAWLVRWWPDSRWPEGERAEIGRTRDVAWAGLVDRLDAGLAVAADYAHDAETRRPTLTGYRDGLAVAPVPDGTCDITAHVALDSAAEAAVRAAVEQAVSPGARPTGETAVKAASRGVAEAGSVPATAFPRLPLVTVRTTQRAALRALGVTGARPPRELAVADPRAYLRSLTRAGESAELTDPGGLGGFGWLMQSRGVRLDGFAEAEPRATAAHGLTG